MSRAARWRAGSAGLVLAALAFAAAGCGGSGGPSVPGGADAGGTHASTGRGSELSAKEVDEMEKTVSSAEGAADQAERDSTDP
jgi:hypothetical protein